MLQPVSALALVLAVLLAALTLLRLALGTRLGRRLGAGGARLRVEASCALGPRQRLHVVEVDGERLLLGASDGGVRLLRRLPGRPPEPSAAPASQPAHDAAAGRAVEASRVTGEGRAGGARHGAARLRRLARALAGGGAGLLALALLPMAAAAEPAAAPALALDLGAATSPERISGTIEIVALLTLISVAPSVLLMATCFTRVVIVLALLRQALGVQQLPPNPVLIGLALAITGFVMAPLGARIKTQALDPYVAHAIPPAEAATRTGDLLRGFLLEHTREKDLALFVDIAGAPAPEAPEAVPLPTLLPAFLISELRTAFEIGFSIFLPFLVIDLVVASLLISMQMIVLPPMIVSLPFKLMLFVLVDGWNLIVASLVRGFGGLSG